MEYMGLGHLWDGFQCIHLTCHYSPFHGTKITFFLSSLVQPHNFSPVCSQWRCYIFAPAHYKSSIWFLTFHLCTYILPYATNTPSQDQVRRVPGLLQQSRLHICIWKKSKWNKWKKNGKYSDYRIATGISFNDTEIIKQVRYWNFEMLRY